MKHEMKLFGILDGGEPVTAHTLTADNGASLTVLDLGGIINRLVISDANGAPADVVCGFDTPQAYLRDGNYHGAIIGRYANRIAGGKFSIGDREYSIPPNERGICALHGGPEGFNCRIWNVEVLPEGGLRLDRVSGDGECGFPGRLAVSVTYLFDGTALDIRYRAETDRDTPVNLTNHSYFNLAGYTGGSVTDCLLQLDCSHYDEVDRNLLPVGEPAPVAGTRFDFTSERPIGGPYDHSFCIDGEGFRRCATLTEPSSGRRMTVYTDMPAVQLYDAVMMNGSEPFKGGYPQHPLHAVCLETQYAPDSPNRPYMPDCLLRAGDVYLSRTRYVFDNV